MAKLLKSRHNSSLPLPGSLPRKTARTTRFRQDEERRSVLAGADFSSDGRGYSSRAP